MPDLNYHCKRAMEVFDDDWVVVHKWLDELAFVDGELDLNHHRHRHHLGGVLQVGHMWGETAEAVARQHIRDDEGRVYTEEQMRKIYPDAVELKKQRKRRSLLNG